MTSWCLMSLKNDEKRISNLSRGNRLKLQCRAVDSPCQVPSGASARDTNNGEDRESCRLRDEERRGQTAMQGQLPILRERQSGQPNPVNSLTNGAGGFCHWDSLLTYLIPDLPKSLLGRAGSGRGSRRVRASRGAQRLSELTKERHAGLYVY